MKHILSESNLVFNTDLILERNLDFIEIKIKNALKNQGVLHRMIIRLKVLSKKDFLRITDYFFLKPLRNIGRRNCE